MNRIARRLLALFMVMTLVVTMAIPVMAEEQVNVELLPDGEIVAEEAPETENAPVETPEQPEQTTSEAQPTEENNPEEPQPMAEQQAEPAGTGETDPINEIPAEVAEEAVPAEETPANADADLIWTSADANYASVDANGVVTGGAVGDVVITVKTENGIVKTCTVHVVRPQ